MNKPKSGYTKQQNKENEKVKLLQEVIEEERQKEKMKNKGNENEETEELEQLFRKDNNYYIYNNILDLFIFSCSVLCGI